MNLYKEVGRLQRRRGIYIYTHTHTHTRTHTHTKKLVTYREEDEPNESMQRSWSLTAKKKKNLMNLYNLQEISWSPTEKKKRKLMKLSLIKLTQNKNKRLETAT